MSEKPTLHASHLDMLSRCGMQFHYRYVEQIKSPPGVALLIGTATHKGIEADLTAKKETGSLLSKEEVAAVTADALRANWDGEPPTLGDDEKALGPKAVKGRAVDMAVALSGLHHGKIAPKIEPVHVERPFRLALNGYPYDLQGTLDIQEPAAVRDTKTSGKTPAADSADRSTQLSMYSLAVKTLDGEAPAAVHLDYLIKTKVPKPLTLSSTRGPDDHVALLAKVERAAKVIGAGAFFPTHPDNWVCSARFCGYFDRCPFGARRRKQF